MKMFPTRDVVASAAAAALLFAGLAQADACADIESTSTIELSRPLSLSYIDERNDYWSTSCRALKPTCIVFPKDAAEVSAIVRILNEHTEEPFATKSGGHSPNNYWSSVDGGPLISTQNLDQVILDQETGVARIGPGQRLDSVSAALDGTGWTFVGGRIGNTGVGGLVLGGGLSYMSAQYGWSASSVIEYELVLANGTITTASATNNPDLYKALKGGGNNFAIIVSYTLQTYRQGDIFGGNLFFQHSDETAAKLLKAVRDFTEYNTDDKAAVIVTAERAPIDLVDSWILFLFYDGAEVPEGIFKNFTDVGPILDTTKVQSYKDLMAGSNWVVLPASVVTIATETIPLPSSADGAEIMGAFHGHWRNMTDKTQLVAGIVASIAFQPFPKRIAEVALEKGGDLIAVDADADRMIIEMNYAFSLPSDYEAIDQIMQDTYNGVRERVVSYQQQARLPSVFLPLFANYAFYRQDYWGRLKPENAAFAKQVAESVDPDGFFRDRTGGWKP